MRHDMFKVVGERPRRGVGYYRTLPNEYRAAKRFKFNDELDVDDEYCSTKLPMRNRNLGWDGKETNENLQPLRRFLTKQVGRPWNDVYAEICSTPGVNDWKKPAHQRPRRIRDYVDGYVNVKTYRTDDGQLWAAGKYGPTPIGHRDLYVDEHGILRDAQKDEPYRNFNKTYRELRAAKEWAWKRVINGVTYEKEADLWFRIVRTERTYMHTYFHGGGIAPTKRLETAVSFRKWTVSKNDLRDLKLIA